MTAKIPVSLKCPPTKIVIGAQCSSTTKLGRLYFTPTELNYSPSPPTISMSELSSCSMDQSYTEIIVVRHGETAWNATGRIQGHMDVELNEVGRQQAASLAERLSREPEISAIYSSDLKRALETAETIAASCGKFEVIKDPDLRERHLGDVQGLLFREAAKVCPEAYRAFSSRATNQVIPGGGESLDQLYHRATSSIQRIIQKHKGKRIVVVTHGGVIRALYRRACSRRFRGSILNTSVNIFQISDDDVWTIKSWGDVTHLNQTGQYSMSGFGVNKTPSVVTSGPT
ncbi:hypothetical protein V6N13_052585 [Hibiscus sabdariffa]